MLLSKIKAPKGANKKLKRVGRGESSGHGKTSTRGGKGQTARKGNSKPRLGFEGGQTPMFRRLPKRGFKNVLAHTFAVVNVATLEERFNAGDVVDTAALKALGLTKGRFDGVRVLGEGEIKKKLTVKAQGFTASAKQKIEAAGGTAEVVKA
jgi:large subunit ribosomal protein L15